MKKIILWVLMFFIYFIWQNTLLTFASGTTKSSDYERGISVIRDNLNAEKQKPQTPETIDTIKNLEKDLKTYEWLRDEAKKAERSQRAADCAASGDCIDEASFMVETWLFSVGWKSIKEGTSTSEELINKWLWTIIQKLMIALWVISLLIMTIWAWYIILYHGEDEYLTKWKWIFTAGIISLVIALSSYYMVNLIGYILYK